MTLQPKRPNLGDYFKPLINEAVRPALRTGGNIEGRVSEAIVSLLQRPEVKRRVKSYSPEERTRYFKRELPKVMQELGPLAPRELLMLRRQVIEGDIAAKAVNAIMDTAAQRVVDAADEALRVFADDDPPTEDDLAEWISTCSPGTLAETESRLAALWDLDPGRVRVVGCVWGGLVTWRDGAEFVVPAAELLAAARAVAKPNPLAALGMAWKSRPIEATPNLRPDRILAASVAQVDRQHPRADRLLRMFSPAAHQRGQLVLPGFLDPDAKGPALPLALYGLGDPNPNRGGGRGAPLALRLFVEAILAVPYELRGLDQAVTMNVTLRDLLARLYPGRQPSPAEYWPRLILAVEALDLMDARIPWEDPETGRGDLRRVVSIGDIPRGPGALDDNVRFVVDLPPGSGNGPVVSRNLGAWGVRSAPAYNALLNLAYRWFDPGVNRYPVGRGHYVQSQDPARYPELSDADVVAVTRPLAARAARRNLVVDGWATLRDLEDAGELHIHGRRVLPPPDVK